ERREVHSFDPLHDEDRSGAVVTLDEVDDADDVRVTDAGSEARLVLEDRDVRRILGDEVMEPLDGDLTGRPVVDDVREMNRRHTAHTERANDLVVDLSSSTHG